jgi:2-polyprenyl-6-methoxyphenol hydroxylase-like FAD-dependent oxidoreductase
MGPPDSSSILIVGAGPTGLALALWLARLGVRARIIDKLADVAPISRALGVHARTLEFYRQLGFADRVVSSGVIVPSLNLWARGKRVASTPLRNAGDGLTPFPFVLDFAQDQHERILIEELGKAGVRVDRQTELTSLTQDGDGVTATLRRADGSTEHYRCAYVAGCDGTHSVVRASLGVAFSGGTYERLFYVADVTARGPAVDNGIQVAVDEADLLAIFDMKGPGHVRFVGTIRGDATARADGSALGFGDVGHVPIERLHVEVERVHWFSTYHVHHRVAEHFRVGSVFLLGDAAHVHSPVGAQGMNTGIGDAVNLAWKLASVVHGEADDRLLDTYENERIAFARRLVATTDRAFVVASKSGRIASVVRTRLFPLFVRIVFRSRAARRYLFRTVSQIMINYRESALSRGRVGSVRAGDRLPWVPPEQKGAADNHAPLASLRWQVHVYGDATNSLRESCEALGLELVVFDWRPAMARSGLVQNACYLVRPDGYVALANERFQADLLREYFSMWSLQPASPA